MDIVAQKAFFVEESRRLAQKTFCNEQKAFFTEQKAFFTEESRDPSLQRNLQNLGRKPESLLY